MKLSSGLRISETETRDSMEIIVADDQAIYRAGMVRVLMAETKMQVVAQCAGIVQLERAIERLPQSIVIFSSSITSDLHLLLDRVQLAASRSILIVEQEANLNSSIFNRVEGAVLRSVASQQLIECVYRIAAGGRYLQRAMDRKKPEYEKLGSNVVGRLTPRELQIVALISDGCKNKEIAERLATKEQIVKNSVRGIYGKIGVSDRLELTLLTVRHRLLAEAVEATRLSEARMA